MALSGLAQVVPSVRSVALPANLYFASIAVDDQNLVLSGTATQDGDQGVACVMAKVELTNLSVKNLLEPRCDDPRLSAAPIVAVQQYSPSMQSRVRIARIDPKTGHLDVGSVVVTYTQLSDSHLEVAQGPGYLWLYAPITSKGAQALRISDATGAVLQDTVISPAMDRPVIAANANGLFLAQAGNSGFLGSTELFDGYFPPRHRNQSGGALRCAKWYSLSGVYLMDDRFWELALGRCLSASNRCHRVQDHAFCRHHRDPGVCDHRF